MSEKNSIKRNISLQTAFQILNTCLPLITAPYLARKLGAAQLGVFSYTSSIVAYFTLVAMLGTVNYGTRCIASVKNDINARSETFWSIFSLQIIVTLISLLAYVAYLFLFCKNNNLIAAIQIISLISCFFDINWFFFGIERFQITVTRSLIIKVLTVCAVLLFVKSQNDLWLYTVIMLGGTLLSQLILFFYLPKYVIRVAITAQNIKEHILPNLTLFIPLLAMSVYHTMDKTMLGMLSTYEEVGYYYNSDKVVNIPMSIINGVGTVMLPRMSYLLADSKQKEADDLFITTLEGIAAICVAISCGIAAVSNEFIPIFYGKGYEACILITIVFTPILLIKGFAVIARTQYLIPMKMEKEFTKSVIGGAIVNLIMNLILIPKYGALGAAIATVIAELVACVMQFYSLRGRDLGIGKLLYKTGLYALMGLFMIGIVRIASLLQVSNLIKLIIEIIIGACFYGVICLAYWAKTSNKFYKILVEPFIRRIKRI